MEQITLNERQICDFEGLVTGVYAPLDRFMGRADYESVLSRQRLVNDKIWPIPVYLDIDAKAAELLKGKSRVELRDKEDFLLAVMQIEEIWQPDREKEALAVFGTSDRKHPGVNYLFTRTGSHCLSGQMKIRSLPVRYDFMKYRLRPDESREIMAKMGWSKVIGYQTRNPIHRVQYEITRKAMKTAGAPLFVFTPSETVNHDDFDLHTRIRCLEHAGRYYPQRSFILGLGAFSKRMAGVREALCHAIIAKNYGCTHFIAGRDYAGTGDYRNLPQTRQNEGAIRTLAFLGKEVGIEIIPFKEIVYVPTEDRFRCIEEVKKGEKHVSLSGSDIRRRIKTGKKIPRWASFNEVIEEIRKTFPSPKKKGFTVFFTGLSGAGKSTIARIIYSRFLEKGERSVSILDGDVLRKNISNDLGFSKQHREMNVKRIGFVASEITKNRGIAICAPIAPYSSTREEVREMVEKYGGFFEIHVATDLDECEKRDRKGMYKKAREGLIDDFTGVSAPYEKPASPELVINTVDLSPEEAAEMVMDAIRERGFI